MYQPFIGAGGSHRVWGLSHIVFADFSTAIEGYQDEEGVHKPKPAQLTLVTDAVDYDEVGINETRPVTRAATWYLHGKEAERVWAVIQHRTTWGMWATTS